MDHAGSLHPLPLQSLPWPADQKANDAFERDTSEWWAGADLRDLRGQPHEDTRPWPDAAQLMHLAWNRRVSPRPLPGSPHSGPAPFVEQLARWMQAMNQAPPGPLRLAWEDTLVLEAQRLMPVMLAPEAHACLGLLPLLRPDLSLSLGEYAPRNTGIRLEMQRQSLGAMILAINLSPPTSVQPTTFLANVARAIKGNTPPLSSEAQALLTIGESERPAWIRHWLQHQHVSDRALRDLRALQDGLPDSLEALLGTHPAPLTAWRAVAVTSGLPPFLPLVNTPPLLDATLPERALEEISVDETTLRWSVAMLRAGLERAEQVHPEHLLETDDETPQNEWPSFRAQTCGPGLQMLSRILCAEELNPEQSRQQHEALRWTERRQVNPENLPEHLIHLSVFGEALPERGWTDTQPDAAHLHILLGAGLHLLRAWEVLLPGRIRMTETIPSPWEETGTEQRTVPGTNGTVIALIKRQPLGWKLSALPLRARLWQGLTETFRRHRHTLTAVEAKRLAVQLALLSPRREEDVSDAELVGRGALSKLRDPEDWRGPERALAPLISALRKDVRAMESGFPEIELQVINDLKPG